MLKLHAYGQIISCDKAVKGLDYILAYKNGEIIRNDSGISDFSGYSLTDEDGNPAEFSVPKQEENEMDTTIRAVVTAVTEAGSISKPLAQTVINRAMEIAHE